MGELLNTNKDGDKPKRPQMEEIVKKWENLGFLDGLDGHVREDIAALYCCKASQLLSGDTK
jgi:hypothetical protein